MMRGRRENSKVVESSQRRTRFSLAQTVLLYGSLTSCTGYHVITIISRPVASCTSLNSIHHTVFRQSVPSSPERRYSLVRFP